MKKGVLFLLILASCFAVRANNVQLQGTVKVVSATGSIATLEVDLSWENSWRDDYNWDATWLFFKYKQGVDGTWTHAVINTAGATVTGGDYTTMSATAGATVQGLFVYPDKDRGGNTGSLKVQVQWTTNFTKAQFDNNDVFVVAHGIEMVYIPYGAYTIGDGSSTGSFDKKVIDSEAVYSTANAAFPKGYQGFYVMKYETSQEEYVEFLNTLTLAEQTALIPGVDALNVGDFVFGTNKSAPNYRNGVILSGKIAGRPLLFDNNLNNNAVYSEDGDGGNLAMNYMSISDACGYASWAGLRPMTEMEYEKACRRPYPQAPEAGEYAWNSATGAVNVTAVTNSGRGTETASNGNVNANSGFRGPVRCGAFARSGSTNQATSGATYWGVMEMSGNVAELCATITNTTISKTGNGTGVYDAGLYGSFPPFFGTRGGGFSDISTTLTTSSRAAVSCFTDMLHRDSTVGFRCAFTYTATSVVSPGTLADVAAICLGNTTTFSGTPASAGAVKITGYIWSVNIAGAGFVVIDGEGGETLSYSNFLPNTTYQFKRKAICPLGEAEIISKPYTIPNTATFSVTPTSGAINLCGAPTFTASGAGSYSWVTPNGTFTGTIYTAKSSDFGASGTFSVQCTGTVSGCSVVKELQVTVDMKIPSTVGCGGTISDSQGNTYTTKLMKDNRCWMTQNLRRTDIDYLYANNDANNAVAHGCHYDWNTAMQGSTTESAQGICPVGWHIPCDGEWQTLEMAYGMTQAQANTTGWRGSDQGTQFKPGGSSGFNMTLSGNGGTSYFGSYGDYWSSSESGANAWYRCVYSSNATVHRVPYGKTIRVSVRCVRD